MTKKQHKAEEVIKLLREAEALINEGPSTRQAARQLGISDQTYYR